MNINSVRIIRKERSQSLQWDRATGTYFIPLTTPTLSRPPAFVRLCLSVTHQAPGWARLSAPRSLEQTLQHGGGVCRPGLLVLDGFLEVLNSIAAFPDFLKLPGQYLRASLPGQTGLLQTQLAHLHVIFACVVGQWEWTILWQDICVSPRPNLHSLTKRPYTRYRK